MLKYIIILFFLTWMAICDIQSRKVSNKLIAAMILTACPFLILEEGIAYRILFSAGILLVSTVIYDQISESIGGADIKIIAVLFVVLSFEIAAKILILSTVIMIAYGLYHRDFSKKAPYFAFVWAAAGYYLCLKCYSFNPVFKVL